MSEGGNGRGWRGAPGWMKLLLAVSLALNLTVAGVLGGNALRHWQDGPYAATKGEPGLDRRQARLLGMVPEARREEAKRVLLARQDEIDRARIEMREAHMALIDAIGEDPLDPERLETALARRHAASGAYWRIGSEQLVEIARELDAGQRQVLADRLEERTRRWMARQDRKKD